MLPPELLPYQSYAQWLRDSEGYSQQLQFVRTLPPRPPETSAYGGQFSGVLAAMELMPYTYQAEALEALEQGHNVVLSTSTASGKSLVFQTPVLKAALEGGTAILLYPTKALANDQLSRLRHLGKQLELDDCIYAYDGDTKDKERQAAKSKGQIILTNPDMLHFGLLPHHGDWSLFLAKLKYIVLDELHSYRGVFGSHVALIIQRLIRLAQHYGAKPQIVAASATIANATDHAYSLTGLEFVQVSATPSRAEREFGVWIPKFLNKDKTSRRSANLEAALLARAIADQGLRGLVFCNSRRTAELVARYAADPKIKPYRAGYTVSERRKLEEELQAGTVKVLVSTSALELGVDIGGLDVVVLLGYPGSVSSFWQRAGRAGRGNTRALVLWVPREDPLDAFYEQSPDLLLAAPPESAIADPENPVLYPLHLHCAARELPLVVEGQRSKVEGQEPKIEPIYKPWINVQPALIEKQGRLFSPKRYPHGDLVLRGMGKSFTLRDPEGKNLGILDQRQAYWEAHPGAIYLHQGETYLVRNLNEEEREIVLLPALEDYYTQPRAETDLEVIQGEQLRPGVWAGTVILRERVTGYVKRRFISESSLEEVALIMPELTFQTEAMWFHPTEGIEILPTLEDSGKRVAGSGKQNPTPKPEALSPSHLRSPAQIWPDTQALSEAHVPSAIHALEHCLIGLLPLFVLAERQDVGGVSYPFYPRPLASGSGPTIFIYDGYPGGVGYARAAARQFPRWIHAARDLLQTCPCESGCPRCVLSPKCGNGNQYLDKLAALYLAEALSTHYPISRAN